MKQVLELANEPLLQTGQARLGAFLSLYRLLAFEPDAPVGQADWGRSQLRTSTNGANTTGLRF